MEIGKTTRGMAVPLESFPKNGLGLVEGFDFQVLHAMAELWVC